MTLLASSVGVGVALGLLSGGRIANIESATIRLGVLLPFAFAIQTVMPLVLRPRIGFNSAAMIWVIWVPAALVAIAVAILNRELHGMRLVAFGVALNVLVVALNGGMPVAIHNLPDILQPSALATIGDSWLHIPMTATTHLSVLADVFPTPGPRGLGGMASLGDLFLAMGVALCLQHLMSGVGGVSVGRDR